ncbi:hypothetical protein Sgleb_73800 [Streptomyces glebosus]|uniref:Uncharacterized protein n=1 Tax=Streptomyces glebosus TaxID=249580 RepID=A0A640T6I1_9ACTN|nr:hypothetical protein [Streptomyces glebosus]GFE19333.1 hypothetical protein Sgleb_73800 [Streptomyces glebosus]GHG62387.1 hypothetical protein GCM10010513_29020 [Streptomyces glebosus]
MDLLPSLLLAGLGQGFQHPVLLRIVLSGGPGGGGQRGDGDRAAVLAGCGVATLGTLFLAVSPELSTGTHWW